jgi:hypothetical protein
LSDLKVLVSDSFAFASDQIAIAVILRHNHDERSIMRIDPDGYTVWENVDPLMETKPTITLSNDAARALLDALLRHYQGASDMHTVRSDLLNERYRVDKLITAVIDLAGKSLDSVLGD